MANKEELAALMASDGDHEKKISLLKKAVVTVTKQKQAVEANQARLQEELGTAAQQLAEAQRENAALQRKIKTLEGQVEQERSSGSAFGQNMLKGLSSIMGSGDSAGRGGGGRGGRGGAAAKLALSPEDVERLISENEQLHRQTYTAKTTLEDAQRAGARETERLQGEVARLQREAQELRRTQETTSATCDRLRADSLAERALGDFCRHFFVAALRRLPLEATATLASPAVEVRWPAGRLASSPTIASLSSSLPPATVREHVALTLQSATGCMKTLLRGVSVLAVVLREQLPSRERATVGDLECLRDRLSVFVEAHSTKKERLMYLFDQLDARLSAVLQGDGTGGRPTPPAAEALAEMQEETVLLTLEWVGFLRAQLPLLVESCVSYLPHGHTYTLRRTRGGDSATAAASPPETTAERGEFVEQVTKHGCATLASIEGSLSAMRLLVQRSPIAYNSGNGEVGQDDDGGGGGAAALPMELCSLLALQQFWWEGTTAVRALHSSIQLLNGGLEDMAEACNKSEIRDALHYVCRCLQAMAAAAEERRSSAGATRGDADAAISALSPGAVLSHTAVGAAARGSSPRLARQGTGGAHVMAQPTTDVSRGTANADGYEELLAALSAADRAAVSYYTQMNYLYVEMAEKDDAVQTAQDAVAHLQRLIHSERAEAEQTRHALQSQISLLSTQLIEMVDASPMGASSSSL
ncbi:hypothetical protein NESM_000078200 [Novymonas esmeraldas]|uniref:Uncharacterized protein n=1 Tax=Novymonas esmeraldas TaxID=1808958 RepID=A0AAW0F4B4_9TRYP